MLSLPATLALVFVAVTVAGTVFLMLARSGALSRREARVQYRHLRPGSRHVDIDGIRYHYLDEGEGPAVMLIHGSYLDLQAWDEWAAQLRKDFRVIRMDRACYGLTGRDPAATFGYEREEAALVQLADEIGIGQFAMAGASSGGTTAARIAARNPQRVTAVILINFPFARKSVRPTVQYALSIWIRDKLFLNYQPGWHLRWTICSNLTDKQLATPSLVRRLTDQANRPGLLQDRLRLEHACAAYSPENRTSDFAAIKAPALLIWGRDNHLLSVESGRQALAAIGSDEKEMCIIEDASHWIPIEKAEESLTKAQDFLRRHLL